MDNCTCATVTKNVAQLEHENKELRLMIFSIVVIHMIWFTTGAFLTLFLYNTMYNTTFTFLNLLPVGHKQGDEENQGCEENHDDDSDYGDHGDQEQGIVEVHPGCCHHRHDYNL